MLYGHPDTKIRFSVSHNPVVSSEYNYCSSESNRHPCNSHGPMANITTMRCCIFDDCIPSILMPTTIWKNKLILNKLYQDMSSTITTYVWPALCFRTNMCISWISHPAVCLLGDKHMESLVWSLPFSHVVATAVLTRSGRASMAGILEKLCFSKTFIETLQKLHFQYLWFFFHGSFWCVSIYPVNG